MSSCRSTPTTVAPSARNSAALSAPIPPAAPVITQTLPSSRPLMPAPPRPAPRSRAPPRRPPGATARPARSAREGSSSASGSSSTDRPARHLETLSDPIHALMMVRLGRVRQLARGPGGQRAVGQPHVVVAERARDEPVILVADDVRQVLDQRAAAREVHQLHPAADAQQRQVGVQRGQRPARSRTRHGPAPRRSRRRRPGSARPGTTSHSDGSSSFGSGGSRTASPPARCTACA